MVSVSDFGCTLLYVYSSIAIILMGKRELVALLALSSWCLVVVGRLFLAMPWGCLWFVIVVFPDHTHYFGTRVPGSIPREAPIMIFFSSFRFSVIMLNYF